uniref:Transmembrane protein 216 n=1 Tax=Scophthalmus maximus TaxID=52904 RepID=A0A8D3A2Y8_SCOMX
MAPGNQPILSSTPLQVLLYLNCWYFAAFYLAEILMFIYKGISLPYPSENLVLDVVLLLVFLGLEMLRIFYGWKGNLCESALWPRARRSSSCFPAALWPCTTCCCRPSSCGWSSSSPPCCSASTALSWCSDSSPSPPSPGREFTE